MSVRRLSGEIGRRQFLRVSTAAAIGVAAGALTPRTAFAAPTTLRILGVGYAPSLPSAGSSVSLSDAMSILTPDPTFISRAARLSVVGGARAAQHPNDDGGLALDAYFPILSRDQAHFPRFSFWYAVGDDTGSPISFRIPVRATTGIALVAHRLRKSNGESLKSAPPLDPENDPLTLSLGAVAGPKLQRGVYAIAFREDGNDNITSWNRFSIAKQSGVYKLVGPDVTNVLLSIAYAS
jgi:hypothetical protein